MSTQIAVRLPDWWVAWIDEQVAAGAGSRAAVITKALFRYRAELLAEHDLMIYLQHGEDPELAGLHDWAMKNAAEIWKDLE